MTIWTQHMPLQLAHPFTISYGTTTVRNNVLVHISDGQVTGVGEAAVVPYYQETPERIANDIALLDNRLELNPLWLEDTLDGVQHVARRENQCRGAGKLKHHQKELAALIHQWICSSSFRSGFGVSFLPR